MGEVSIQKEDWSEYFIALSSPNSEIQPEDNPFRNSHFRGNQNSFNSLKTSKTHFDYDFATNFPCFGEHP